MDETTDWSEIIEPTSIQDIKTPESTSKSTKDIRDSTTINETERIIYWCNMLDLGCNSAHEIVELFKAIREDKKGWSTRSLSAIFTKIERRDRSFFRSFTNDPSIMPAHQQEYGTYIEEYHKNYQKAFNISYINKSTKKKIRVIVNKALFIAFLRSDRLNNAKFYEIAMWLEYGFNYFIDPQRERISYDQIVSECQNLIYNTLPQLPDDPSQLPMNIIIKLPATLPIKSSSDIGPTASILRTYYKFTQMSNKYIISKTPLPNNPEDLQDSHKDFFPVRSRIQLTKLKEAVNALKEDYLVPSKLPDEYFNLPPPKIRLPGDFRDLPLHLSQMFPILDSPEELKKAVKILRDNDYALTKIPKDYIIQKRILPPAYWFSENNERTLPITDQQEADTFISDLRTKFRFSLPLSKEWISEDLSQDSRSPLPNDLNQILQEFNLLSKPNKDLPNFDQIIRKIRSKYNFEEFPNEWISSTIPDLPNISEAKQSLTARNINFTLPIKDSDSTADQIKTLRTYFYFQYLPNEFIYEDELPDPGTALLPQF
jgi:hypothetical protein